MRVRFPSVWLSAISLLLAAPGWAAASLGDSLFCAQFRSEFAVPDLPAMKVLGLEGSEILRPSTAQTLTVVLSDFAGNGLVLPGAMAVEVTPYSLVSAGRLTLADYLRTSRLCTNLRVSLGTVTRTQASGLSYSAPMRDAAIGVRFTPVDQSDLRNNRSYLRFSDSVVEVFGNQRRGFRRLYEDSVVAARGREFLNAMPGRDDSVNGYADRRFAEWFESATGFRSKKEYFEAAKSQYIASGWNAEKLDFAMAVLLTSADSGGRNVRFRKFSAWLTYGRPAGGWGQLLVGANGSLVDDNVTFSASPRLYAGANRAKAFIEAQYGYSERIHELRAALGAEVNPSDWLWVDTGLGLDYRLLESGHSSSFTFDLKFKLTTPKSLGLL